MKFLIYIKNIIAWALFLLMRMMFPLIYKDGAGILFVSPTPIGDLVIASIIFKNENLFSDKIYFLIDERYNGVYHDYEGKIEFISINTQLYKWSLFYRVKIVMQLRRLNIGCAININDNRTTLSDELTIFSGAIKRIALSYESGRLIKIHKNIINKYYDKILFTNTLNQFEKLYGLLKILRIQNPIRATCFYLTQKTIDKVKKLLGNNGIKNNDQFIAISPFASKSFRSWPIENYLKLIIQISESFNYKILLLGDDQFAEEIDGLSKINLNSIINLSGKTSIVECAGIIKLSKLFIGNDSGLTHIAKALNVPLISIIGGGMYNRFFPYNADEKYANYLVHKMDCFGCEWKCIYKEPICLTAVSVEQVFNIIKNKNLIK